MAVPRCTAVGCGSGTSSDEKKREGQDQAPSHVKIVSTPRSVEASVLAPLILPPERGERGPSRARGERRRYLSPGAPPRGVTARERRKRCKAKPATNPTPAARMGSIAPSKTATISAFTRHSVGGVAINLRFCLGTTLTRVKSAPHSNSAPSAESV